MELFEILKAALLGIIEGITEWLPISSTGHLILAQEFIRLDTSEAFWQLFLVVIQLGAILAVVVLFWNKLFPFSLGGGGPLVKTDVMSMWFKVLVAIVPALLAIPLDSFLEQYLNKPIPVALMLILYGVVFIVMENRNKNRRPAIRDISQLTYRTALLIGVFQVLAVVPGTSRSGATIIGAMLIGTSRTVAAEFTFFLAIPTMLGASLLKLLKFGFGFTSGELLLLAVGTAVAFLVSLAAIKFLMSYIKKHDFKAFGYYRIALGLVVILYFTLGV